ncbi:6-phosphogluconate dehydrogenase family protein [Aspergillus ellipticus CBS 707.79]|uniref:6-phosphogluconate dehydrogenase family protein n=1 Tax=Aspergillus ellipticus CBS 707.79 TaxID=1448320 RepID=A0A319D787_9EURO|nr:6-phosphogluconate dehydrogenase family protein [Aspergillus ellipticus CBS 707.79]
MSTPQVGWIGLGSMGLQMSKNLQRHLNKTNQQCLIYTNRTLSRGASLETLGAKPVETVAQVVQASDIVFSCVSDDKALRKIVDAALEFIAGKTFVDCSTVHPETSVTLAKRVSESQGRYVSAPVFGAATAAAKAELIFVTAGPKAAKEQIAPYLKGVMGRSIIDLGEQQEKANLMKISGNIVVVGFMELISEAHVFAEKTGLGCDVLESMIHEMFGAVPLSYSRRITTGAYAPPPGEKAGFDVALAIKDARHALNCASGVGVRLDVTEVALAHMELAQSLEGDGGQRPLDSSSIYGAIRTQSGLGFYTDAAGGGSS